LIHPLTLSSIRALLLSPLSLGVGLSLLAPPAVLASVENTASSEACMGLMRDGFFKASGPRPYRVSTKHYEEAMRGNLPRYGTPAEKTERFIQAAREFADRNGVKYEIMAGESKDGPFPFMRILPVKGSPPNEEALRIHSAFGGMKLILSPYELKTSKANAFFMPSGRAIGVPVEYLYHPFSSDYLHEVQHATSYYRIILGHDDTFVGSFRLLKGDALSSLNSVGYTRHASVDEILATELSIRTHAKQLAWNYRFAKSAEAKKAFYADPENERLLNQLYHELRILPSLARQSREVMTAARERIIAGKYSQTIEKLSLGTSLSAKVEKVELLVPSTQRVFSNSRGVDQPVEDGARIILYGTHQNREQLLRRVDRVIRKSEELSRYHQGIIRKIYNPTTDHADLRRTNLEELIRSFPPSMR
jgi:hypothetical protein